MYGHTLYRGRKYFCRYDLQAFSTEEILKCHIKDCFKINGKQMIKMSKKGEYIKFKNYERQMKSLFMIYGENNGKRNLDESYANKYQKGDACNYGYKLACADDKFSKPCNSYLGEDAIYNFTISIIEDEKSINKKLLMLKNDGEDFENATKC